MRQKSVILTISALLCGCAGYREYQENNARSARAIQAVQASQNAEEKANVDARGRDLIDCIIDYSKAANNPRLTATETTEAATGACATEAGQLHNAVVSWEYGMLTLQPEPQRSSIAEQAAANFVAKLQSGARQKALQAIAEKP